MGNKFKFSKPMVVIALVITIAVVGAANNLVYAAETGCLRSINSRNIDTLDPNSKWNQEPLKTMLNNVLNNNLSDTSDCDMVWKFSAEDFETIQAWCLEKDAEGNFIHEKGTDTNKEFIYKFGGDGDNNHCIIDNTD